MAYTKQERAEAVAVLKQYIKKGDTLYTILRHTSSSGMTRVIDVVKPEKGEMVWLGYNIAVAMDLPYDRKNNGVKVAGGGMDMGFALIYDLGAILFGRNGQSLNQRWL